MSSIKQIVGDLGREINRLWARQNPQNNQPLVPLPADGHLHENGDSRRHNNEDFDQDESKHVGEVRDT